MRSDYLDTSNPYRLLAFFQFCDAANMARDGIATLEVEDPRLRRLTISMIDGTKSVSKRSRSCQSLLGK